MTGENPDRLLTSHLAALSDQLDDLHRKSLLLRRLIAPKEYTMPPEVTTKQLPAQVAATYRTRTSIPEIFVDIPAGFERLAEVLTELGTDPAGTPFTIIHQAPDGDSPGDIAMCVPASSVFAGMWAGRGSDHPLTADRWFDGVMTWATRVLTPDRFEDFADVVNPNRRATHCWCLSHRLRARDIEELGEGDRERAMRRLCERPHPPGVVTYLDGTPVGWCNIGPRSEIPRLAGSKLIRPVDDVPVWSIVCLVVRVGHRRKGVTAHLISGAVEYAASRGAPAVEAYPVDPEGRMDTTMAFVGTRSMFAGAGFDVVGSTEAVASRLPRLVVRRTLSA